MPTVHSYPAVPRPGSRITSSSPTWSTILSGSADHHPLVPAGAVAPVVLEPPVGTEDDHLEVEAEAPLDEPGDREHVVAERRALVPAGIAGVVAPPVLDVSSDCNAELEVAHGELGAHAELALDHAGRARHARAEGRAGGPDEAVVIVAPEVLHLPVPDDRAKLEVAVDAVGRL